MRKLIGYLKKKENGMMSHFALAFANGSVRRICFYIFHQPKMPEDLKKLQNR